MGSSATITLFHEYADETRRPASFVISMLAHALVLGLLGYGIIDATAIKDPVLTDRYVTRQLELHQMEPHMRRPIEAGENDPEDSRSSKYFPSRFAIANAPAEQIPQLKTGPQTVVQPDIRSNLALTLKLPIAQLVTWKPSIASTQKIVLLPPQRQTAADAAPSLNLPNNEERLADLDLSSSSANVNPQAVLPSTTTPLNVRGPGLPQAVPVTSSLPLSDPAPAPVMTQSDLYMAQGTVTLPPMNQAAPAPSPGLAANRRPGNGNGQEANGSGAQNGTTTPSDQNSDSESSTRSGISTERITLPRDGQFGVVVVGSSLEEKYPETTEIWAGRLVYTVYLHVGLTKNWILQYSLPPSTDAGEGGSGARLEAPWPFVILRPGISSDEINADALIVHGFVNDAGLFERLAIAFPLEFMHAQNVLDALQEWRFRPASQNGQSTNVEVLLIIPVVQ